MQIQSTQLQTLQILQENIEELKGEIDALSTVRDILNLLVSRLDESIQKKVHLDLLEDDDLIGGERSGPFKV